MHELVDLIVLYLVIFAAVLGLRVAILNVKVDNMFDFDVPQEEVCQPLTIGHLQDK